MGYYTHYTLTWKDTDEKTKHERCDHKKPAGAMFCPTCGKPNVEMSLIEVLLSSDLITAEMKYALGDELDGEGGEASKWHDHQLDMLALSNKFRSILFTLHGEGDETGDLWNEYYLNGKTQTAKARIVFDEFDPDKLK